LGARGTRSDQCSLFIRFFNSIGPVTVWEIGEAKLQNAARVVYTGLAEGAKVSFEVVMNRGKESAENLKIR
jgi:hypothetical protein